MKKITNLLIVSVLVGVISLLGYVALSHALDPIIKKMKDFVIKDYSKVTFMKYTLTMTPAEVKDGGMVTYTFSVNNNGPKLSNVEISVTEPSTPSGAGMGTVYLFKQIIIKPGVNTYNLPGISFRAPEGDNKGVMIRLLDMREPVPHPVITAGYRVFEVVSPTYKLGK